MVQWARMKGGRRMYDLTDREVVSYLCQKHGFQFKKGFGQNFLTNEEVLFQISSAAEAKGNGILEIGPGFGTLTAALAHEAEKVVSVEVDNRLFPVLSETLAGFSNIKIVEGDVLKVNLPQLLETEFPGMEVSVAANLPYYITTPILMKLLSEKLPIRNVVVMVQKEVADRMLAAPGSKDYGALTLAVQYYSKPSLVTVVPKSDFVPSPKVDSAVVKLEVLDRPSVEVGDEAFFFKFVKAVFTQRRKTLVNGIKNSGLAGAMSKEEIEEMLFSCDLDKNTRGETLPIEKFAEIVKKLKKI